MTQPKLFLHAGGPKTGSSALQSAFALSIDRLAGQGIHYPAPHKLQDAVAGMITSGNYNPARLADLYHGACKQGKGSRTILFSNESSFRHLPEPDGQLLPLARSGVEIETVLFIRNPVELACSSYVQMIKRHGVTTDPMPFFRQFGAIDRVERFVEFFDEHGLRLHLFNYSNVRDRLFGVMEGLLGVADGTLQVPPVSQVNRSLTRAEMRLVRDLNAALGAEAGRLVADALCNEVPDIRSEPPIVTKRAYKALVDHVSPVVERLNARLPSSEAYEIASYEQAFGDQPGNYDAGLTFSDDQQRVIRATLARALVQSDDTGPPGSVTRSQETSKGKLSALWSRLR